jgi:hypothetical protein
LRDKYIRHLISKIKCNVCGQHFDGATVEHLGTFDEYSYYQLTCSVCGAQAMVTAIMQKDGEGNTEVITDLSVEELSKSTSRGPVSTDDMLDMINYLKNFDGNFSGIFS